MISKYRNRAIRQLAVGLGLTISLVILIVITRKHRAGG